MVVNWFTAFCYNKYNDIRSFFCEHHKCRNKRKTIKFLILLHQFRNYYWTNTAQRYSNLFFVNTVEKVTPISNLTKFVILIEIQCTTTVSWLMKITPLIRLRNYSLWGKITPLIRLRINSLWGKITPLIRLRNLLISEWTLYISLKRAGFIY